MHQVAAMENQVGRGLAQIRQDCLEGGAVAVDIGNDGDAHAVSSSYTTQDIHAAFQTPVFAISK